MAGRIFNRKQALEREVKDIYSTITVGDKVAATAELATTEPIIFTSVATGSPRNTGTITVEVEAAAANPTDTVLAEFTGTANDITITITPNDGTNNPDAAATATINLTADVILTSVAPGSARNTTTFTLEVAAAAANPTDTILAEFTGTAAAIVCTITPNDGTNNSATPVNLTTAELVELINTGAVAGKTVTVTDGDSLRELQTATGGGATALADSGEGDGEIATFAGGTNPAVDLTTEELVELINDGSVAGKTVTVTDASSLRALQTATGGDSTALADSGEGDGEIATFAGGGAEAPTLSINRGIQSIARNDTGDYTVTLHKKYASLKYARFTMFSSTAQDIRFQLHTDSVASAGTLRFMAITGTTKVDPADDTKIQLKLEVKNSGVI